ncbi:hypothetical protein HON36_01590 [Candidatus Parcubacteria bacterium]|jgi:hypothetical protein|nr:hypothetical protein [Candidatus Parcubacteria bacterium]
MIRFKKNCRRLRVGIDSAKSHFEDFLDAYGYKNLEQARSFAKATEVWIDGLKEVRFDAEKSIQMLLDVVQKAGIAKNIDEAEKWLEDNVEISEESQYIIVDGNFDLMRLEGADPIIELPDHMSIQGNAEFTFFAGKHLPHGLYVNGSLYLSHAPNLKELPRSLSVGGDLHIDFTQIESISAGIFVSGDIYVSAKLEQRAEELKKMGKIKGKIFVRG